MPELPEVETIIRGLRVIKGAKINALQVLDPRLDLPANEINGRTIEAVKRRGKYILFLLSDGGSFIVHLRMSGRLAFTRSAGEEKHTRFILHLDCGKVYFINPRRLGTAEYAKNGFPYQLGVEPFSDQFTVEYLTKITGDSHAPIKSILMDQKRIAGLGNIYSAEALWRAKIDPRRKAKTLTQAEIHALHAAIVQVLTEAIERMGTTLGNTVSDYRNADGDYGRFQGSLTVYGRTGRPCRRCNEPIERIIQAGRSTFFCCGCQK
ncbi:bifunctional DNA-formamidopyrimidine glycosylase/DNA-(apurinic or apyrimidinic site) lyase [Candidatus Acetothermia bacterium]|jgi:formamidopyrimidine-DNA glycosylase|nr:bifunctional DNA-formamidopyrimidine glycosylase/DNA-(apurinic or apyrimidinic site) lyase [Candidatus Acetothermia bacterium]MCI2426978.1 bifunctional DNA-formamidopyrimidine glycosylase/DNA-(apurinic or apyrimidinic site) lyase [Candidatus Acetothermia bacterium]MCI2428546.1 bifunctional DNA-formamidopyrimidine glycosylase/DNA-(apurinic or apyrimidinic site) lyase [Candidatus Acetothermia bacterium]